MRVLFAPDSFGGTLTAVQAAEAMAEGWRRQAPADELVLAPMSDGGPGFVDTLHASLGGRLLAATVSDQYGDPVPAAILHTGETAYVEAAQACGLQLTSRRDPEVATTYGVGKLLLTALQPGVRQVVVGLGGTATNDAGAGFLAALGADADPPNALRHGPRGVSDLAAVDLSPVLERLSSVELVAATDVDNPLLGLRGATNVYGTQKGIPEERKQPIDAWLGRLAELTDRRTANSPGAGAAGGLGFALLLAGARRVSGVDVVAAAVDLPALARSADLVVTGEGSFDFSSRSGKVPYGVAAVATAAVRPCIALAGRVLIGAREIRTLGVESAYSMVDVAGEDLALTEPAVTLAKLAERVARTWSR